MVVPATTHRRFSRATLVRLGRNEALARSPRGGADTSDGDPTLRFSCECEDEHCRETIHLSGRDYAWVRTHSEWLILFPGHSVAGMVHSQRLSGCVVVGPAAVAAAG